jgi:Tfp pilus assembly protein PilF
MSQLTSGPRASARSHLDAAVRAHLSGDRAGAIRMYRKCLAADPAIAEAHNNLGTLLAQGGNETDARPPMQRALALLT